MVPLGQLPAGGLQSVGQGIWLWWGRVCMSTTIAHPRTYVCVVLVAWWWSWGEEARTNIQPVRRRFEGTHSQLGEAQGSHSTACTHDTRPTKPKQTGEMKHTQGEYYCRALLMCCYGILKTQTAHSSAQHTEQQHNSAHSTQHTVRTLFILCPAHSAHSTTLTQGAAGKNEGGHRGIQVLKAL